MSSIIPELGKSLSKWRRQKKEITNHRTLLPEPAAKMGVSGLEEAEREKKYVCHGSTRRKETTSTLRKYDSGKTMMQFPCGGPCVRYYGFWRDPEEKPLFRFLS
jgi:hypothetical protein